MNYRQQDINDIRALCEERHPHSADETIAWLAVHRLLREFDCTCPEKNHGAGYRADCPTHGLITVLV